MLGELIVVWHLLSKFIRATSGTNMVDIALLALLLAGYAPHLKTYVNQLGTTFPIAKGSRKSLNTAFGGVPTTEQTQRPSDVLGTTRKVRMKVGAIDRTWMDRVWRLLTEFTPPMAPIDNEDMLACLPFT